MRSDCVLVAMRELLGDPSWGPEEIVQAIQDFDGLPSGWNDSLMNYAPVYVWSPASLDWSDEENWYKITWGWRSREILPHEQVIISYMTSEERAHAECIFMRDFARYADKHFICFITKEVY